MAEFIDRVEVADDALGAVVSQWVPTVMLTLLRHVQPFNLGCLLVCRQRVAVNLHACRPCFVIFGVDLVEAEHLAGRGVELVVVDLDRGQGRVEGQLDVGNPSGIPEGHGRGCGVRHGCAGGVGRCVWASLAG